MSANIPTSRTYFVNGLALLVFLAKPIVWVFAFAGFFWLAIMLSLALSDYLTRGWR